MLVRAAWRNERQHERRISRLHWWPGRTPHFVQSVRNPDNRERFVSNRPERTSITIVVRVRNLITSHSQSPIILTGEPVLFTRVDDAQRFVEQWNPQLVSGCSLIVLDQSRRHSTVHGRDCRACGGGAGGGAKPTADQCADLRNVLAWEQAHGTTSAAWAALVVSLVTFCWALKGFWEGLRGGADPEGGSLSWIAFLFAILLTIPSILTIKTRRCLLWRSERKVLARRV